MAMGTRKQRERQEPLWYRGDLPETPGHPFYERLNRVLDEEGFDRFCEAAAGSSITRGWDVRRWLRGSISG